MRGHRENEPCMLSHPASRRSSLLPVEHRLAGVKVGLSMSRSTCLVLRVAIAPHTMCPGCGATRSRAQRCTADPGPLQTVTVHASRVYPTCAHLRADLG